MTEDQENDDRADAREWLIAQSAATWRRREERMYRVERTLARLGIDPDELREWIECSDG